jgi:BlaI family transcriptional regulator, penicillinase repressor
MDKFLSDDGWVWVITNHRSQIADCRLQIADCRLWIVDGGWQVGGIWRFGMVDVTQMSKRERQIMDVIYGKGEASISEVLAGLPEAPARGAVRTLLRIMEEKGYVTRRAEGREIFYKPTQGREPAAKSALERVLAVFFDGSLEKAVASHLSDAEAVKKMSKEDLQRLSDLIEEAKKREG